MASESKTNDLSAIPSSVSGDGTTFVKGLKRYLRGYSNTVEELIDGSGVGQVTNITLTEQHVTVEGVNQNNIYVTFDTGSISNYAFAQIWITENVKGEWTQDGITNNSVYTVENVAAGKTYYIKVVGSNKEAYSNFERATISSITINGSSLICNAPAQFYWDNADKRWRWEGYVDNGYTDFFEIRTDKNAGVWDGHRLDAVSYSSGVNYSTVAPPNRSGTAYLFVRNVYGNYNTGVSHIYAVGVLPKPAAPILSKTVDGVSVEMQGLPNGAASYIVVVDGDEYEVYTSQWTYFQYNGSINVKYCFVDSVGRSEWSDSATIDCGRTIGTNDIATNAITAGKIAANAVTTDKLNANAVTAAKIATGAITIGGSGREVSIADGAINGSKITAASIIGDKIAANTITASKLKAENISLSGALAITGGAVKLSESGLECTSTTGGVTFNSSGMSFKDTSGNTYAHVGRQIIGEATHGQHVTFTTPWDIAPFVLVTPKNIDIYATIYDVTDTYLASRAENVTRYGFDIICGSYVGSSTANNSKTIPFSYYNNGYIRIENNDNSPYATQTVTIPTYELDEGISGNITASYSCTYNEYIRTYDSVTGQEDANSPYLAGRGAAETYLVINIMVNGSVVWTKTTPTATGPGKGLWGKNCKTTVNYPFTITFARGSTVTASITVKAASIDEHRGATCMGTSDFNFIYTPKIAVGALVKKHDAMFVAIEKPNSLYTVT